MANNSPAVNQANPNSSLAKADNRTIESLLNKMEPQFQRALPKHFAVDRLIRVALTTINKNPKLKECTQTSLLSCLMDCAQLGLEPDSVLGRAYLIPFNDRRNSRTICTLIVGYKGLVELAMRSGRVSTVMAQVVHEKDKFEYSFGLNPKLDHEPSLDKDPGKVVAAYAYAKFKDGAFAFDVMSVSDIEKIRMRSLSRDSGPWKTDWNEMARKTVLKRLSKYLPLSPEFMDAVGKDNEWEANPVKVIQPEFKDAQGQTIAKDEAQDAHFTDAEASELLGADEDFKQELEREPAGVDESTGELTLH